MQLDKKNKPNDRNCFARLPMVINIREVLQPASDGFSDDLCVLCLLLQLSIEYVIAW